MPQGNKFIEELIVHEYEKYTLQEIGVVDDTSTMLVKRLCKQLEVAAEMGMERNEILDLFYNMVDFSAFAERVKKNQPGIDSKFARKLKSILQRDLLLLEQRKPNLSPDKDLRVGKTINFHLSNLLFKDFYGIFTGSSETQRKPSAVLNLLAPKVDAYFPISFERFLERLQRNDTEFWERLYDKIIVCAKNVTNWLDTSYINKALTLEHVRVEAYILMKKRIDELHPFTCSAAFGGYITNVCKNICGEYVRKTLGAAPRKHEKEKGAHDDKDNELNDENDDHKRDGMHEGKGDRASSTNKDSSANEGDRKRKKASRNIKFISIEDMGVNMKDMEYEDDWAENMDRGVFDSASLILKSIDPRNGYDVAQLVAVVLCNEKHPLNAKLLRGMESKVALLKQIIVDERSYDEIIDKEYPHAEQGGNERKKLNAKLRQDVTRVKKELKERMIKMIEDNG